MKRMWKKSRMSGAWLMPRRIPVRELTVVLILFLFLQGAHRTTAQTGDYDVYLPLTVAPVGAQPGGANTFYVSPDGNDGANGQTPATAWATFDRAWDDIEAGDTLILLDGVYRQSLWPNERDGEPGNPITVRAQNDGKAIIDGEGVRVPVQLGQAWPGNVGNWYVIEGIVARNGDTVPDHNDRLDGSGSVIFLPGHHNVLRRVSAYDASPDHNSIIITFDARGDNNTVEDCVAAGSGRKAIMIYNSNNNVVRRCLAMWTQWDGREADQHWPWGENIDIYNADDNLIENSISLGFVPRYGITLRSNAGHESSSNNRILGSIAAYSGRDLEGTYLEWSCPRPQPSLEDTCIDIEDNDGYRVGFKFFGSGQMEDNVIRDVLLAGNATYGLSFGGSGTPTDNILDHITATGNATSVSADDLAFLLANGNTLSNSLLDGTIYNGEGARLQHRYVNGTLTNQPLWPWPMEQRIQAELGFSVTDFVSDLAGIDVTTSSTKPLAPMTSHSDKPVPFKVRYAPENPPIIHIPHFSEGDPFEAAIAWLGQVNYESNYADLRFWHDDQHLKVSAHVIDRRLWYDESALLDNLSNWDAVSLFLDTGAGLYRFDSQLNHWEDDEDYQAAYRLTAGTWNRLSAPFEADTFYQGTSPNEDVDNRGWSTKLTIPFASLGAASTPPVRGTTWRVAVVVYDRDGLAALPTSTAWPTAMNPIDSSTWSRLVFNKPRHSPPPTVNQNTIRVRQGLNGAEVEDAHVGGHTLCGTQFDPDFFNGWGDANYAGYDEINIQNQWNIADWPCFSKFYITFPLGTAPAGKVLVSATLTLHQFGNAWGQSGVEPSWIQVSTVAEEWNEATLSWNNAPQPVENVSGTWVEPMREKNDWPGVAWNWDVSYAVARAIESGQPLRLVMYSPDGAYHSGKYFRSSEAGEGHHPDSRPTLTIKWGTPINIDGWPKILLPLLAFR